MWTIRLALRGLLVVIALDVALPAAGAEAAPVSGAGRTSISFDLFGRAAPYGAMAFASVSRRWSEPDGDSALLVGRYLQAGVTAGSNPAYAQVGLFGEWVPLAPLQLRLQYDAFGFFGANGALLRFPSASARFGRAEIAAASGAERAGIGHRLQATPTLRVRIGRLLLRNQTDLAWYHLSDEPGWYYEWEYDTLLARNDLVVSNRLAALVQLWTGSGDSMLLAGPAYEVTRSARAHIARQRAEGMVFWSPLERLGPLARPRLLGVVGVNVQDRNRQGDAFAVLGVGAEVDL